MMQPYMYILFWLITSHNLHSEKKASTRSHRQDAGSFAYQTCCAWRGGSGETLSSLGQLSSGWSGLAVQTWGCGTKVWGFQLVLCLGLSNTTVPQNFRVLIIIFAHTMAIINYIYIIYMIYWYTVCFYHISGPAVGGALHPLWSAELFLRHLWIHWRGPEGWRRDGGWKGGCQDAKRKNR
jgi:hypothetical protein